jgi:hypothetical protein
MSRALDADAAGKPDALAWFDAGYAAACFSEMGIDSPKTGLSWVDRAIAHRRGDPEMEFAAYLITLHAGGGDGDGGRLEADRERRLRRAIHGARDGSLLEKNLLSRVGGEHATLETLRKSHPRGEPARGAR